MEVKSLDSLESLEIFNEVSFGIELETCVHIIDNPLFTFIPDDDKIVSKKAITAYYNCLQNKMPQMRFQLILDSAIRATRYDQWIIMPDSSLVCDYNENFKEKYCIVKGQRGKNCKNYAFYPIEIVSPKLTGRLGLRYLTVFWQGILYGDNLVYSINDSQGLHTNISHPKMDAKKFIMLWVTYEPIILQIIGDTRRIQAIDMASPLSTVVKTGMDLVEIASGKFVSVSVKSGKHARLEVRLREGSFNYNEVMEWIMFCMWMLSLSIVLPITPNPPEYPEYFTDEDKNKLLNNFFNLVYDKRLIEFLLTDYNNNKEDSWPNYKYTGPSGTLFKRILPEDLSIAAQKAILKLRKKSCDKN